MQDLRDFEHIRYKRLKQLGIVFDWSFEDQRMDFKNLALKEQNPPLFDQGILHSCGVAKSKVLEHFLERINYWPKSIIFVDDMMFNIQDLKDWCASKGIIYQGFHYTGLELLITEFNQERALLQINHLINYGIWLTDPAADALM